MKLLRVLLFGVAGVVTVLIAVGLFVPQVVYETQVEIDRPVETVFAVVTDESRMGEWQDGFKAIEPLNGRARQIGSIYRITFEERGQRVTLIEEVTARIENEVFAYQLDHEVMQSYTTVHFESLGHRTRLVATSEVTGKGVLWRALLPLMKQTMAARQVQGYHQLKRLVETEPVS